MELPYMQFYSGDYLRDTGVRSVSLAARGLWMDLLCFMHQSSRVGFLQHPNGTPYTDEQIARMVGHSCNEVTGLLTELDASGVYSRTPEGTIYSRRMVVDERKRIACKVAGKRGGNPLLMNGLSTTLNGGDKVQSQSQSQSQKAEEKSEAKASSPHKSGGSRHPSKLTKGNSPELNALLVEAWNGVGLAKVVELTRGRQRTASARLSEPFFRENYAKGLELVKASKFCNGVNDYGWKADFDWFIKPDTLPKILEGKYAGAKVRRDAVTGRPTR